MAITPNGTTLTLDAANVGCIRALGVPERAVKEVNTTCLDSDIETFVAGNLEVGAELIITRLLDPEVNDLALRQAGEWIITFPLQTSSNTTPMTMTFNGFVRSIALNELNSDDEEPDTEVITVRLTSKVVVVNESA